MFGENTKPIALLLVLAVLNTILILALYLKQQQEFHQYFDQFDFGGSDKACLKTNLD